MGIVPRLRRARVGGLVARALLGAAMTVVAFALEWRLARRARRHDRG